MNREAYKQQIAAIIQQKYGLRGPLWWNGDTLYTGSLQDVSPTDLKFQQARAEAAAMLAAYDRNQSTGGSGSGPSGDVTLSPAGASGASGSSTTPTPPAGPAGIGAAPAPLPEPPAPMFSPGTSQLVVAFTSQRASGPFEVGIRGDKHFIGDTEDGEPMNANHLSTNSYFFKDPDLDAPLYFEGRMIKPVSASYRVPAHIWFDDGSHPFVCGPRPGWWKIQSECSTTTPPCQEVNPEAVCGDEPIPPPVPPKPWRPSMGCQPFTTTHIPFAVPALLFRPQNLNSSWDLRVMQGFFPREQTAFDNSSPVTARIEPYGFTRAGAFRYTQQALEAGARFRGGTCPGGLAYLPPELSIDDYVSSFAPNNITKSTTYHCAVPGVYWGAGVPTPVTGSVHTGYRWGATAAGYLTFDRLDASGSVSSNVLVLDTSDFVGIGVDPTQKLDVNGDALIRGGELYLTSTSAYIQETGGVMVFRSSSDLFGFGSVSPSSTIHGSGSLALPTREVTASPTAALSTDWTLLVDCNIAGGDCTIELPLAALCQGRVYNIKKIDSSSHSVVITPNPADLIDGAATFSFNTQYQSFQIQSDGATDWHVI